MYINTIEEELAAWNRMVPRSVEVAKTFRNEGEVQTDDAAGDNQQQQQVVEKDPFDGINLDDLPDDVREKLVGAKKEFATLQTDRKNLTITLDNTKKTSSRFQSEADRLKNIVQKHNLPTEEGNQNTNSNSGVDEVEVELFEQYLKMGIGKEQAQSLAKVNAITAKALENRVINRVGHAIAPHLQNVGVMTADKIVDLAEGNTKFSAYLQDSDINQSVRLQLGQLAKAGGEINEQSVETIINMAIGQYAMRNGGKLPNMSSNEGNTTRIIQGGTRGGTGSSMHGGNNRGSGNNTPSAANDDTAKAANTVLALMKTGLPKKK